MRAVVSQLKNYIARSIRSVPNVMCINRKENQREVEALISRIFLDRPSETCLARSRDYHRLGEDPEEVKNHARWLRCYSWRNDAARCAALRCFVFFSFSYHLIRFFVCLPLPPPSHSLSHPLVVLILTFCTAERRIGSLNKMTRLFIGAFVRVKVGTTFLFGRRPWNSLWAFRLAQGRKAALRLIGRWKFGRADGLFSFCAISAHDHLSFRHAREDRNFLCLRNVEAPPAMLKMATCGVISFLHV